MNMTDIEKQDRIRILTSYLKSLSEIENELWAEKRQLMDETYKEL